MWIYIVHIIFKCDAMTAERAQVAADLCIKLKYLSHQPACRLPLNYIYYHHLLLLTPKADTHFTVPQRVEG